MNAYLKAMRHYFDFMGRASRAEFWLFTLFVILFGIVTVTIDVALGFADEGALVFTGLLSITHVIPSLAVSVRRLHDTDKSGWWLLIGLTGIGQIVLFVFYLLASTDGPNRFGPDPRAAGTASGGQQGPEVAYGAYQAEIGAQGAPQAAGQAATGPHMGQGGGQAALAAGRTPGQAGDGAAPDPLAEIEKLAALRDSGAIEDDEFRKLKADLIARTG